MVDQIGKIDKDSKNLASQEVEDIFDIDKKKNTVQVPIENPNRSITPEITTEVSKPIEKSQIRETEPVQPEITPETQIEQENKSEKTKENENSQRSGYTPQQNEDIAHTQQVPVQKSEELIKIENILSENLDDLFLQMTPQQQMNFQIKGEETANKINLLMNETKVKVKEILVLIKEWLRLIPGINKFFLEQEAKIKTDRLMNMKNRNMQN